MNLKKPTLAFKKIFIFIFLLISALAITACSNTTGKPNGNLDDTNFVSISDAYGVTNKELYNALRPSATSVLRQLFDEQLFKDQLETVNSINTDTDTEYVKYVESQINTAIFSSTDVESIVEMTDKAIAEAILSYVDSFMIAYPNTNREDLTAFLRNKVATWKQDVADDAIGEKPEDYRFGYFVANNAVSTALIEPFKITYAKRIYAKTILDTEVDDVNSSSYIKESELVSYYKNNLIGQEDVAAIIVPFKSVKENQEARYFFQVKSNTRGEWYQLPDVLSEEGFNALKSADVTNLTDHYGYAKSLFEGTDLNLNLDDYDWTKWSADVTYKSSIYTTFYEKYNTSKSGERNDVLLTTASDLENNFKDDQILTLFLAMYDFLNSTSYTNLPVNPEDQPTILATSLEISSSITFEGLKSDFNKEYSDVLFTNNTSLRSEVYNIAKNIGEESALPHSKQPQSLGSASFLIYVLEAVKDPEDVLLTDENTDEETFADNETANAYKAEARTAVYNNRLTDTYVTTKVTALYEDDTKVNIYDYVIRSFYEQSYTYSGSNGYKNNNVVADINGYEITVDVLFEKLATSSGLSTALDLIMVEVLNDLYADQITTAKRASLKTTFETTLTQFKANSYESSGYPSSLGLNQFLLLAFQSESTEEAFQKAYIDSEVRSLFIADYENHYGENDNIYQKWATLAKASYDNYVGIETSHLLIFLDRDLDGSPDDMDALSETELAELTLIAKDFVEAIKARAALKSTINATTLQEIVTEFNDTTRFPYGSNQDIYPNTNEWAKFKRAGLYLQFESLGDITNLTNSTGSSQQYVQPFFDYAIGLAEQFTELKNSSTGIPNGTLPFFAPNPDTTNISFNLEETLSEFGWHLLLVTKVLETTSSKVTSDSYVSEFKDNFDADVALNAKNENDYLSYQQIMIYLKESAEETGVESLPTDVQTAITNYFTPLKTLYDSESHQLDLLLRLLANTNGVVKNSTYPTLPVVASDYDSDLLNKQLVALYTSNRSQLFSYSIFENAAAGSLEEILHDEAYAKIYGNWFTILEG